MITKMGARCQHIQRCLRLWFFVLTLFLKRYRLWLSAIKAYTCSPGTRLRCDSFGLSTTVAEPNVVMYGNFTAIKSQTVI